MIATGRTTNLEVIEAVQKIADLGIDLIVTDHTAEKGKNVATGVEDLAPRHLERGEAQGDMTGGDAVEATAVAAGALHEIVRGETTVHHPIDMTMIGSVEVAIEAEVDQLQCLLQDLQVEHVIADDMMRIEVIDIEKDIKVKFVKLRNPEVEVSAMNIQKKIWKRLMCMRILIHHQALKHMSVKKTQINCLVDCLKKGKARILKLMVTSQQICRKLQKAQ